MLHPPCWKQEGQIHSAILKQVLYSTVLIYSFFPSRCGGVAHACSPSAWKPVAVGGLLGVPGQPEILDEILSQKQKMKSAVIQMYSQLDH